jgi:hypothetical protein
MKERRIKRKKERNEAEKIILETWCATKREGKNKEGKRKRKRKTGRENGKEIKHQRGRKRKGETGRKKEEKKEIEANKMRSKKSGKDWEKKNETTRACSPSNRKRRKKKNARLLAPRTGG